MHVKRYEKKRRDVNELFSDYVVILSGFAI